MLNWFEKKAPIRRKFRTLAAGYGAITTAAAVTGSYAVLYPGALSPALAIGVQAAAVVAAVALTLLASRLICTPYVNTVVRMEALADGDLQSPIDYTEHRDCVGRMTRAMSVFRDTMEQVSTAADQQVMTRELAEGLDQLARGNLEHRIDVPFPAQHEAIRTNFNKAIAALEDVLSAVSEASGGVSSGANEISAASNDLSRRTEQQAASLEETAAAMDEITTTVREASASATRANKAAQQARTEAEHSGEVVGRAIQAMSGIERASSEISEIISVIDGIAFQTNLLALNAGVEAARAGDAGKGFAVVASEVRALAQRSADAAKDVKARITASSEQVDAGVTLVSETEAALRRIITSIGELDTLVADITTSAEQQASGLQQVNTAVAEMDGVTQQNAAMVEQATAASRSLAAQADALAGQIGRFRLHQRPAAVPQRPANPVHQLQARAAGAQPKPRSVGNAAVAVQQDDWSEF